MPGYIGTNLSLRTEDDIFLGSTPYYEWAPPPYNKLQGSVFDRVQMRIASYEDTTGLYVVDMNLADMKLRLWEDIIPLSRICGEENVLMCQRTLILLFSTLVQQLMHLHI